MAISWQLQGVCGCYRVYMAVTGSTTRSFSAKIALRGSYRTAFLCRCDCAISHKSCFCAGTKRVTRKIHSKYLLKSFSVERASSPWPRRSRCLSSTSRAMIFSNSWFKACITGQEKVARGRFCTIKFCNFYINFSPNKYEIKVSWLSSSTTIKHYIYLTLRILTSD